MKVTTLLIVLVSTGGHWFSDRRGEIAISSAVNVPAPGATLSWDLSYRGLRLGGEAGLKFDGAGARQESRFSPRRSASPSRFCSPIDSATRPAKSWRRGKRPSVSIRATNSTACLAASANGG